MNEEERVNDDQIVFSEYYDTEMLYFFDEFVEYDQPFYINLLSYTMHGGYDQDELYDHIPEWLRDVEVSGAESSAAGLIRQQSDKPLAELHRVANLLDSPISDRTNYLNTPNLG